MCVRGWRENTSVYHSYQLQSSGVTVAWLDFNNNHFAYCKRCCLLGNIKVGFVALFSAYVNVFFKIKSV